ncbi:tetratricopeptide repeat protein [Sphingomonas soli]|uniref:tetratricopeptide repeat protein n=1 Tax=Sphingomonas soli TaxID=266127 RepID=UPI000834F6EB|nr:outer membrane protein assembly factor BamD [Sphingomonas soli]
MRILISAALMTSAFGLTGTALAQDAAITGRVDRLEREMRAVQRKVFPGGAGQTVEPQIVPESNVTLPGTPSGSALVDLSARVTALESQSASLTGQIEQGQYRLRQLEEAFAAYKRSTDARIKALEDTASSIAERDPIVPAGDVVIAPPAKPAAKPVAETPVSPAVAGTRAQQVAAIAKPESGDPAEDGYTYGFRLWQAKLYPEARRELEAVATKYPKHRRASYAQNLLGRAYLDANAPSLAAVAFYQNYKNNPNGERAPDSLYYLAQALVKLKKPAAEVCKVYGELTQLYGDKLSAEMTAGVAKGRAEQKCK